MYRTVKAPNFITQDRHGGFIFRRKIPKAIRTHFRNKREIRRSLRTHHRGTALQRARWLAAQTDQMFGELLRMPKNNDDHGFRSDFTLTIDLDEFRRPKRINVDAQPHEINELNSAVANAIHSLGASSASHQPDSIAKPASAGLSLKTLSDQWIAAKIKAGKIKERTEEGYKQAIKKLFDIVGENITLGEFNDSMARRYRDGLLDYPNDRWKVKGREAMTLDEVRAIEKERISPSAAGTEMTYTGSFFSWLHKERHTTGNPLKGLAPEIDKEDLSRDPFTLEEAQAAFNHPWFRGEKAVRERSELWAWKYWLPILGACTGARIEELSRLRKKDIREQRGIMAFEFMPPDLAPEMTARRNKTSGKSKAAHRLVPVHAILVELGFLDFVAGRPDGYIFDGLTTVNTRRSHSASNRLAKALKASGIEKTMHNLRHTMRDLISESGADWAITLALMGHSPSGQSASYGTALKRNIKAMAPGFEQIDFGDIFIHVKPWHEIKDKYGGR